MPHDLKYGSVEMENRPTTMTDDEPVFIIRARDAYALPAIARYEILYTLGQREGFNPETSEFIKGLREVRNLFEDWQRNNTVRQPD